MFGTVIILLWGIFTPSGASASSRSRLILENSNYVSHSQPYFRDSAEAVSGSMGVGADGEWRYRKFDFRLRAEDQYAAAERWNYVNVFELSAAYQLTAGRALVLGRKMYEWNAWETDWRQGVFQSRYMINKLRSEPAGLVGAFFEQGREKLRFTAGVLANVPDLGAHFFVRDNQFYSANPWFNPPADAFVYNSNLQEIRYSVNKPSAGDVVAKPGFAAKSEYRAGAHLVRASFAYKPMPQLLLGFPSRNQVVLGNDVDYMRVRIEPRVAYHRVFSTDYVLDSSAWTWSGNVTYENPVSDSVPEDFTAQQIGPAWITVLKVSRRLEEEGPNAARISLGAFKINGGDRADRGDLAGSETLFERRYQYNEALMLSLSKAFRRGFRFPVETEARWIYDRVQNGGVFSLSAAQNFTRDLRVMLEADFLGLMGRNAEITDGFLSVYRANDRLGLGMSYVF